MTTRVTIISEEKAKLRVWRPEERNVRLHAIGNGANSNAVSFLLGAGRMNLTIAVESPPEQA